MHKTGTRDTSQPVELWHPLTTMKVVMQSQGTEDGDLEEGGTGALPHYVNHNPTRVTAGWHFTLKLAAASKFNILSVRVTLSFETVDVVLSVFTLYKEVQIH